MRLAPAYDIVSTTAYIKKDSLALTLDGSKRFPSAKKLITFAKMHCNLQPAKAKLIIEEVADAVAETATGLRQHTLDFANFKQIGENMLSEWNVGLIAIGRTQGE